MSHVVEPAILRLFQWRGDPVARLMLRATTTDPYPLYAGVRQRGLVRSPLGAFIAADHATVASILRDRRFSSSPTHQKGYLPPSYPPDDPRAGLPDGDLLNLDPPDHTRLRRLVSGTFTPRAVADLEPWIREVTVRLLAAADDAADFDLIEALAFPLPIAVICHLLGVPARDQAQFRAWGHDVAASLDPQTTASARTRSRASEIALTAYLQELVRERRSNPDDSILSGLIAAEEEGDRLTSGEVVRMAFLLLIAGFETTVNLIGNGTVALLGDPDGWDRLRQDQDLVPAALEEMLRYDSPVQLTSRIATEDVEVCGRTIAAGRPVFVSIGGANRDPDVFERPDEFLIDRPDPGRHLSFSLGLHHCLGAALARLEGRVAIEELTRRYPALELTAEPTRRSQLVLRGFESIPVRARQTAARSAA
ncbi:MAG TPA: cytochrome P450 [Trebonia sp.]|nr:cytochrome P450 [Trebonia sp.]